MTTSSTFDKPLPSLDGMTGFIAFEASEGSRLSDFWQQSLQRTKPHLSRVHVVPRKTLLTPSHALVDLALLAPCRDKLLDLGQKLQ